MLCGGDKVEVEEWKALDSGEEVEKYCFWGQGKWSGGNNGWRRSGERLSCGLEKVDKGCVGDQEKWSEGNNGRRRSGRLEEVEKNCNGDQEKCSGR